MSSRSGGSGVKPAGSGLVRGVFIAAVLSRYLSGIILFLMMFYVTADVTSRYLFNAPFRGTLEMTQMMLAAVIFLAIAELEAADGNVRVELFTERLSARKQLVLRVIYSLAGLFFLAMLIREGISSTVTEIQGGITTDQLRVPSYPGRLVIPLGAFLMALVILITLFRDLSRLARRD